MFLNFYILNTDDEHGAHNIDYPILLNSSHIASIKPINILFKGNIILGYWIRMNNGKKYKATRIPLELLKQLDDSTTTSEVHYRADVGNENGEFLTQH